MKQTHITTKSLIAVMLLIAAVSMASSEDAPSMWMVQDGDNIDLMVNTSETSSGANAHIHFDPECINITDIDFTGSPWQPMEGRGWSHQHNHVIMALTNFSGVAPGEYRIAKLSGDWLCDDCVSTINITRAEPVGVVVYNTTITHSASTIGEAQISIGDGSGDVTLPIIVSDADNVGAVDVTLKFDPTVLTVTGASGGDMDCTYTNLEHVSEGWIRIGAIQGDNPGLSGQFTLLNLDFESVRNDATCSLELSVTTFKDATPECNQVSYSASNGTYISSKNGDSNGDDVVDIADAAYIAKHVLGIAGYEQIDEGAADVTGDGLIDMSDAMYLTKHVIGISGFEVLR
jgi:hypothetical protein